MGKHSGEQSPEEYPIGKGPHPTPEESQAKADSFERQWEYNAKRGDEKK